MSIQVNQSVVSQQPSIPVDAVYSSTLPKIASTACLSEVEVAPWTNRVPEHEPWARTMMGNTPNANSANDECDYTTNHNPQFVDDDGEASYNIGRVEGTDTFERGEFWRR